MTTSGCLGAKPRTLDAAGHSCLPFLEALEPRVLLSVAVLSETFEGIFPSGGWSVGDSNSSGTAAYWDDVDSSFGGEGTHGGSWKGYCAGVGHGGSDSSPTYQNSMTAYMSRSINLSGYSGATLSFWDKIPSIESNWDYARVYIDSTKVWERTATSTSWTNQTISLNSYVGGSHTLKFEFLSDSSVTAEGWYLDDILVTGDVAATDDAYEDNDTKSITDGRPEGGTNSPNLGLLTSQRVI